MLTITKLLNNFKSLDTDAVINDALVQTGDKLLEQNKDQLKHGMTKVPGQKIEDTTNAGDDTSNTYKWESYADEKYEQNPLAGYGNPDLERTGKWKDGLYVEFTDQNVVINSTDDKNDHLKSKYPDIVGLGGSYKKKYLTESLGPTVQQKISNFTGLTFR